jgi:signal transduction histidine kinase
MNTPFRLTLAFLLLAFTGAFAQNNLPPVYELKTDTAAIYKLEGNYSQLLEDHQEGKYTIDQVASPAFSHRFHANQTARRGIDRRIHHYWFRFRIHNQLNKDVVLYFDSPLLYTELYTPQKNGQWQVQRTGERVPWSERSGLRFAYKIPFTLRAGQQVMLYQRVQLFRNRLTEIPPPSFIIRERFLANFYTDTAEKGGIRDWLVEGILLGFWFILALYNFFIFLLIRERAYLYFFLWTILYFFTSSLGRLQVLLGGELIFLYSIVPVLGILAGTFQVLFAREFLQTSVRLPAWDKVLLITLIWNVAGNILLIFLIEKPISFLDRLVTIVGLGYLIANLLIFLIGLKLVRKGSQAALLFLIGMVPLVLVTGYALLLGINFLVTGHYPTHNFEGVARPAVVWMSVVFSGVLLQRYLQTRKELVQQALEKEKERSQLIEAQKLELEKQVSKRTAELKQSLEHLKATQAQLIQSEKMASLGELTAGIAHEIQNPLNFVNNFSEVNTELIEEMKTELVNGNGQEAMTIADDIKENEQKIIHHGKRADAIVKGMLQHSRTSTGQKELTDINALADEYLRLSYHGLRAKDKSFNADFKTDFDETIGKIEVIQQEFGRVLLNLFNNAFYAVSEKKKQINGTFVPTVSVTTRKLDGTVEITVKDNGTGISQKVVDKIFQPFFTTKPTGQGTGLGLSLSYDIIKAHGGELEVETKEGEFAKFIIKLPVR